MSSITKEEEGNGKGKLLSNKLTEKNSNNRQRIKIKTKINRKLSCKKNKLKKKKYIKQNNLLKIYFSNSKGKIRGKVK